MSIVTATYKCDKCGKSLADDERHGEEDYDEGYDYCFPCWKSMKLQSLRDERQRKIEWFNSCWLVKIDAAIAKWEAKEK